MARVVRGTGRARNRSANFWSLLMRGLDGIHGSVEPFHLFRYLDERVLTLNMREADDHSRFAAVLACVAGRRLTYAEVTSK